MKEFNYEQRLMECKKQKDSVSISSSVEIITPKEAEQYLQKSPGNRNLRDIVVGVYAKEMKSGKWKFNGQTIIFDEDNLLMDGHHRLTAVIRANMPIVALCVRGVPRESNTTIDSGNRRTTSQVFKANGVKNYNKVSSVISVAHKLNVWGRIPTSVGSERATDNAIEANLTSSECFSIYQLDGASFDESSNYGYNLTSKFKSLSGSMIGGLHYYLISLGYPKSQVEYFFNQLCSFNTSQNTTIDKLRTTILKAVDGGKKLSQSELSAFMSLTWNAYVTRDKLKRLTRMEGEYPKFLKVHENGAMPFIPQY